MTCNRCPRCEPSEPSEPCFKTPPCHALRGDSWPKVHLVHLVHTLTAYPMGMARRLAWRPALRLQPPSPGPPIVARVRPPRGALARPRSAHRRLAARDPSPPTGGGNGPALPLLEASNTGQPRALARALEVDKDRDLRLSPNRLMPMPIPVSGDSTRRRCVDSLANRDVVIRLGPIRAVMLPTRLEGKNGQNARRNLHRQ